MEDLVKIFVLQLEGWLGGLGALWRRIRDGAWRTWKVFGKEVGAYLSRIQRGKVCVCLSVARRYLRTYA